MSASCQTIHVPCSVLFWWTNIKYANPVDETLNITIEDESRQVDDEYTVELWSDQMGKLKSVTTESTQLTINTAQFTPGYYTLRLNKNGKFVQTSTVLIK